LFKIYDGRKEFYQWDQNQKVIVNDTTITEVHFSNLTCTNALIVEVKDIDGVRVADVPNILLTDSWDLYAYGYCGKCYTKQKAVFEVEARTKPSDYIYTETEVKNYEAFEERLKALEEAGGSIGGDITAENIQVENAIKVGKGNYPEATITEKKIAVGSQEETTITNEGIKTPHIRVIDTRDGEYGFEVNIYDRTIYAPFVCVGNELYIGEDDNATINKEGIKAPCLNVGDIVVDNEICVGTSHIGSGGADFSDLYITNEIYAGENDDVIINKYGVHFCSEDAKLYIAGEDVLGDINAALDNIIAIQEALIGG
jgi:hypothetical protein